MSIWDITSVLKLHFKNVVEPEVGKANDGLFWTMKSQFEQFAKGVKVYTFPVAKLFGININSYAITDYDLAKEFMVNSSDLGGNEELAAWWQNGDKELVARWLMSLTGMMLEF